MNYDQKKLEDIVHTINDLMIHEDIDAINLLCALHDPDQSHPVETLALLRGSFPYRKRIPQWTILRDKALLAFKRKGLDGERELQGLWSDRDVEPMHKLLKSW